MEARILVVDDDPAIRRLVDLRFQLDHFDVLSAGGPEEALRLARQEQPDAIVLDVMMPGMDGFEVCRRVRQEEGVHQPVIVMLTARAGTEFMVAGLAAGADDYVTKPPNLDELVERVRSRLRQRHHEREGASSLARLGGGAEIAAEVRSRLRAKKPCAVGCVDLRRFEVFNLRYGYERGDELLEWLAGLLSGVAGRYEGTFVGRLGSDDFVVVADPAAVEGFAETFRQEYADAIAGFYDPEDAAAGCVEVADERGRVRRHPLLYFSMGVALSSEVKGVEEQALLELAVERNRWAKFRPTNSIIIGPQDI
jgi:PleD family two-component response regulator